MALSTMDLTRILPVLLVMSVTAVNAQFLCVASCESSGNIVGTFMSLSECCVTNSGGGFELLSDASIPCQSCSLYEDFRGDISFRFDEEMTMAGRQAVSITCVVTAAADVPEVTSDIVLKGPDGRTLTFGTITSPMALLNFVFDPFEASDFGEYTCNAIITSRALPGMTFSTERSVNLEAPPTSPQQPPVDIDGPESFPIAGESYTLTCRVNGTASEIQWIGPNGQPIVNSSDITVGNPETVGGVTTSVLTFRAICLGDSGRYMCQNDVTTPNTTIFTLTVEVPPSDVEIATPGLPTIGEPYQSNCTGTVPASLQGGVTVTWFGPNGTVITLQTGVESATEELTLNPFQLSDVGVYTCRVSVSSVFLDGRQLINSRSLNVSLGDIDECALNMDDCDFNAECVDQPQGFDCICTDGFTGNGTTCTDINECALESMNNCDANAECRNTQGSFECDCNSGFTGNGVNCEDINECALEDMNNCDANAECRNTQGSFECDCNTGFTGNGVNCEDINECVSRTDNCNPNARCRNTQGSFKCDCDPGFRGDGAICEDIDECFLGIDNCDQRRYCVRTYYETVCSTVTSGRCVNTVGSFSCICYAGFRMIGDRCRDINECAMGTDGCSPRAKCRNVPGSFVCQCRRGYEGNGRRCFDINECIRNLDSCDANAICRNTLGSHRCVCRDGFVGNGRRCTAIDIAPDPRSRPRTRERSGDRSGRRSGETGSTVGERSRDRSGRRSRDRSGRRSGETGSTVGGSRSQQSRQTARSHGSLDVAGSRRRTGGSKERSRGSRG